MSRTKADRIRVLHDIYFEIFGVSAPTGTSDWKIGQDTLIYFLKIKPEENLFERNRLLDMLYAVIFDIHCKDTQIDFKVKNMAIRYVMRVWPKALPATYIDREISYEWLDSATATPEQKEKLIYVLAFVSDVWKPDRSV